MAAGGTGKHNDTHAQAWVHRQNIQRYKALLRNPADPDDHDQIRRLLRGEEDKLRSLGLGD